MPRRLERTGRDGVGGRVHALRATGIVSLAVLALAAAIPHAQAAVDRNGARAPGSANALAGVSLEQNKLKLRIGFHANSHLPAFRGLNHSPTRWRGAGRRLCVAMTGRAAKRRLLCLGGLARRGEVRLGVSRFLKNGAAVKGRVIDARVARRSNRKLRITIPLREAGISSGRFRYFATARWSRRGCGFASGQARSGAGQQSRAAGGSTGTCGGRLPRKGMRGGRIAEVVRSGCVSGARGAYTNGSRSRKRVALTFDDGPTHYTSSILRSLDARGAKATFFHLGSETGGRGALMRQIIENGHEIGNHSWAHEFYPGAASMDRTNRAIRAATGFTPCVFRPPYRLFNSATVGAAQRQGMSTALWDIDTEDYRAGSGTIYSRAIRARSGSIVLMHDGGGNRNATVAAVPSIIANLQSRGYKLVTLTKLMGGRYKLREDRGRGSAP